MKIIGIDPGKTGYIVTIEGDVIVDSCPMPVKDDELDVFRLYTILSGKSDMIITETPFIQQGNKNRGILTQLVDYGQLKAICKLSCSNFKEVSSRGWKAKLKIPGGSAGKKISIERAKQYYPRECFFRTQRCTTPSHDFAEAALLAYYADTNYNKKERII